MYGTIGLAAALLTTIALLGMGASDSLMDNVDDKITDDDGSLGEDREAFKPDEQVVEGHTTFATIDISQKQKAPREHEPTQKDLHCEETNPTDPVWPIYEDCEVTVGPIAGVGPVPTVEEVHAEAYVANTGLPLVGNPDEGFWDAVFSFIPGL